MLYIYIYIYINIYIYIYLVFFMLSRLFIAAFRSHARKGLISWLLFVMFNCVLLLSHVVSWVRCGT